jgi:NAD(P)-dependent dehydrogenase (short-subunit alcohol dehydrogenase family)
MNTVRRVDNQISVVVEPAADMVWITPGPASGAEQDTFHPLRLSELFGAGVWESPTKPGEASVPTGAPPRDDAEPVSPTINTGPSHDVIPASETSQDTAPVPAGTDSARADGPSSGAGRVAGRYVMRLRAAPAPQSTLAAGDLRGPVLVLGDNKDAAAVLHQLRSRGVAAHQLPISNDPRATIAALERAWAAGPIPYLLLMTGRDPDADRIDDHGVWAQRRQCGVTLPYRVCQRWVELAAAASSRCMLAAAVSLGGDFGFTCPPQAPEGGALGGLLKSIYLEALRAGWQNLRLKLLDAPPDEAPAVLAHNLLRELVAEDRHIEVACAGQRREVVEMVEQPAEAHPPTELPRGGTWLLTGGARGITAAVARRLGHRLSLKLHLLGRSPLPPQDRPWMGMSDEQLRGLKKKVARQAIAEGRSPAALWDKIRSEVEISRNMRALDEAGVRATYHQCDVTDRDQVADTIARIRAGDGPIEGIIHGAGLHGAGRRLPEVTRQQIEQMLRVKIDAALTLMELTAEDPLRYFIAFGSISGRFGANSRSDYATANEMLAKLVGWYRARHPRCRATTFHWCPWGEVGMMVSPKNFGSRNVMKLALMPPDEGVAHLLAELRAGMPESETLVSDRQYYDLFYGERTERGERVRAATGDRPKPPAAERLLGAPVKLHAGASLEVDLDLDAAPGPSPATGPRSRPCRLCAGLAVALFAEAARRIDPSNRAVAAVREMQIGDSRRGAFGTSVRVRLHAEREGNVVTCRLTELAPTPDHAARAVSTASVLGYVDLDARPRRICFPAAGRPKSWRRLEGQPGGPPRDPRRVPGALKGIAVDELGIWGEVVVPSSAAAQSVETEQHLTLAEPLEACFFACALLARRMGMTEAALGGLPWMRLGRLPAAGERCLVRALCSWLDERDAALEFALLGEDGAAILHAQATFCAPAPEGLSGKRWPSPFPGVTQGHLD